NGPLTCKCGFKNGVLSDPATQDLTGETAFRKILSWNTGNFEILQAEPERKRTIFNSYQGLLLESAQALDEAKGQPPGGDGATGPGAESPLARLARFNGVEFVISVSADDRKLD